MKKVVGIKFKDNGTTYEFLTNNLKLPKNVTVIVETERGEQFGKVVTDTYEVEDDKRKFKSVVRISTKHDYLTYKKNQKDSAEAMILCKKLVNELNIKMQIVDAEYIFDRSQLIFRFVSNSRVDFRNLVKQLAATYKTRIELIQIGSRDKAKEIGGLGLCGREICCSKCLKDFNSVSITMAKNQNISLNPEKINGVCGRLLCCLKYENEMYKDCKKCCSKDSSSVNNDGKNNKVTNANKKTECNCGNCK